MCDRHARGGHLLDLGRGRIHHVREPGARLRPPVFGDELPRSTSVPFARDIGVDLLVEVRVQPHLVVIGGERGQLVEQRELVDVHPARRERDPHPRGGRWIVVRGDQFRAVPHHLVDRLHHVGVGPEGQRAPARVESHADVGGRLDGRLHVRTGRARGVEVVLVGNGGHAPEQRLTQHCGCDRLDVRGLELSRLPPVLEDRAEPAEPGSDQHAFECRDRPRCALVQVLMRVHEAG